MKIEEYAKTMNIKWMPINLKRSQDKTGKIKKHLQKYTETKKRPEMNDFKDEDWDKEFLKRKEYEDCKYVALDTSVYHHWDVDIDKGGTHELIEKFKRIYPHYFSIGKDQPHFIFKSDIKFDKNRISNKKGEPVLIKIENTELLTGQWGWAKKDTIIYNPNGPTNMPLNDILDPGYCSDDSLPLIDMNTILIDQPKKPEANIKLTISPTPAPSGPLPLSELTAILHNIDDKYCDDYDTWTKIVWSLKNQSTENYQLAKDWSKKSNKYNEIKFEEIWRGSTSASKKNGIGTVYHYSKVSNKQVFLNIKADSMDLDSIHTDYDLAKAYLSGNEINHGIKSGTFYSFSSGKWVSDPKKVILIKMIGVYLIDIMGVKLDNINKEIKANLTGDFKTKEETRKRYIKVINSIKTYSKKEAISKEIYCEMLSTNIEIEFDENNYLLAFNNKCINLKTMKFRDIVREDYILTYTGYDHIDSSDKALEKIEDLISSIFPNKEMRKTYLYFAATSLYGIAEQSFVLNQGRGGNGKGLINGLLLKSLGNYGYTLPSSVWLDTLKEGANPQVSKIHNKRLIVSSEPDDKKLIDQGTLKDLTGGGEINSRACHSNETKVILKATYLFELNDLIHISGNMTDAVERRLKYVKFNSQFVTKARYDEAKKKNPDTNLKVSNPLYVETNWQDENKVHLINYLINWIKKYGADLMCKEPYICEESKKLATEYLKDSDVMLTVLSDKIKEEVGKEISLKDLFGIYKQSEYYKNLDRGQKLKQNKKWMVGKLKKNIHFGDSIIESNQKSYLKGYSKLPDKDDFGIADDF